MTWKLTIASRSNELDQQLQALIPASHAISKTARGGITLYEILLPTDTTLPREWLQQNAASYTVHKDDFAAEHWHASKAVRGKKLANLSDYERWLSQPSRKAIIRSILSRENASTSREILDDIHMPEGTFYQHSKKLIDAEVLIQDRIGYIVYYYISHHNEALQDVLSKMFPDAYEVLA